jgi:predicted outer membrane repeat protein
MSLFILHYRTTWDDYFSGTDPTTTLVSREYTSNQTLSVTNVYVLYCLFNQCTSEGNGGALYCTSVTYLLIESSSFFSCKSIGRHGGAIYFQNTSIGECVLHKVCGNDCCSTTSSYGVFAYIYVKSNASSKNYVNYSSIVRCVDENSGSYALLRLYYGKNCIPSINISMNKCECRSGISFAPSTDSTSVTCSISYSSFTDNNASYYNCIHYNNAGAKYEMKCCNIIRNTQINLNKEGTIRLWGNMTIRDSCILENKADFIFNPAGTSYIFTIMNCTIDKTTTSTGDLIMQNTVTKSFIHALNHISTRNCNVEYDSIGTLTPITPPPLSSKKMICYYSCKIFFNQPRLRDIISLICVFVFNFIYPYPSCGH